MSDSLDPDQAEQNFSKIVSGILPGCQTIWIQIRRDILSGLIWIQTVCNGYLQTSKRVNPYKPSIIFVGHMQTVHSRIRCHKMWSNQGLHCLLTECSIKILIKMKTLLTKKDWSN